MNSLKTLILSLLALCLLMPMRAAAEGFDYALMIGGASQEAMTAGSGVDDDELAAYQWFTSNNGAYACADDVTAAMLNTYKVVWVSIDRVGIEKGWRNLPAPFNSDSFASLLANYAKAGGTVLLTNHATQLATAMGRFDKEVNIFGSGDGDSGGSIWTVQNNYGNGQLDRSSHPIFNGLTAENYNNYGYPTVALIGKSDGSDMWREDHNCFWELEPLGFGSVADMSTITKFETLYNCLALGTWGQNTNYHSVGIVDFSPTEIFKGRILAIGLAAYEWHANNNDNAFQANIERLTSNALEYLKGSYAGTLTDPDPDPKNPTSHIQYLFNSANASVYGYDAAETAKIAALAEKLQWDSPNEWNYVYNKVAFVGWYATAQQYLAAPDVDDDEKAACEWATRQGATYIPASYITDLSMDLSMFDAFWINIDFDESDLAHLKEYAAAGRYLPADHAYLNGFADVAFPEDGVHKEYGEGETSWEKVQTIKRILSVHTAGVTGTVDGIELQPVGLGSSLMSDEFIKALKLRHQLGWNMLLTNHASYLISMIDRYSFDTTGDGRNDRFPRRWNFKKGSMVEREGYARIWDGADFVPDCGSMSPVYGHLESLYMKEGPVTYQEWPGTIDFTRVGVDYARLGKIMAGEADPKGDESPVYNPYPSYPLVTADLPLNNAEQDELYETQFAKFLHDNYLTPSRLNKNVYRGMTYNTAGNVKVNDDPNAGGASFPNQLYIHADQYENKFQKTITLFAGARAVWDGVTYNNTAGPNAVEFKDYSYTNVENHNAYFAIDRVRRVFDEAHPDGWYNPDESNKDDNTQGSKWYDLYTQSAMEPIATRPDIDDYCMGTLIRWYPTNQDWRNSVDDLGNIVLPGNLNGVIVDKLDSFAGKAFTLSMPGYEWNPSQTFESWYAEATAMPEDVNNGYYTPFEPELYRDESTPQPLNAKVTASAAQASDIFNRTNIEQLTHNALYELVRGSEQEGDETVDAISVVATSRQLLKITDAGKQLIRSAEGYPINFADGKDYYLTYRNVNTYATPDAPLTSGADFGKFFYIISYDTDGEGNVSTIDIQAVHDSNFPAFTRSIFPIEEFISNPENVVWTADFYVRAIDKTAFDKRNSDLGRYDVADVKVEITERQDLLGSPVGPAVKALPSEVCNSRKGNTDDPLQVYGAIIKRGGDLGGGYFNANLTYRYKVKLNGMTEYNRAYNANAQEIFSLVMPKAYGGEYSYSYSKQDQTVGEDAEHPYDERIKYVQLDVESPATRRQCQVYIGADELKPRKLDSNIRFHRPNVEDAIISNYDIRYTIQIISRRDNEPDKILEEASGVYRDTATDPDKATGLYSMVVKNVNPHSDIYPEMQILKTEYRRNTEADKSMGRTHIGAYGRDVTVTAPNDLQKETARIGAIYYYLLEPGHPDGRVVSDDGGETYHYYYNTVNGCQGGEHCGYKVRYLGHHDYTAMGDIVLSDGDDTIHDTETLEPEFFMIETIGAAGDYACYPYLVRHIDGHQHSTKKNFWSILVDDDDPLIGSYIAEGFTSGESPTIHVTPIFIFDNDVTSHGDIDDSMVYTTLTRADQTPAPAPAPRREADANGYDTQGGVELPDMGWEQDRDPNKTMPHIWDPLPDPSTVSVASDETNPNFSIVTGNYVSSQSSGQLTGIDSVSFDIFEVTDMRYYDISGRCLGNLKPQLPGVYMVEMIMSDGSRMAEKIYVK